MAMATDKGRGEKAGDGGGGLERKNYMVHALKGISKPYRRGTIGGGNGGVGSFKINFGWAVGSIKTFKKKRHVPHRMQSELRV